MHLACCTGAHVSGSQAGLGEEWDLLGVPDLTAVIVHATQEPLI